MHGMLPLQETFTSIKLHSCRLYVRKWSHYRERVGTDECYKPASDNFADFVAKIREGRSFVELIFIFTFRNNLNKILYRSKLFYFLYFREFVLSTFLRLTYVYSKT